MSHTKREEFSGPWWRFFKRPRYTTLSNHLPSTDSVEDDDDDDDDDSSSQTTLKHRIGRWIYKNEMTVLLVVAIALARAYPPLGAKYLYPHITTTWIFLSFLLCTCLVTS